MENMVEVQGLDKSFGDIHAVRDLSFRVRKGELFAFLGVNGAGKSTTISVLCGQLKKDGGTVFLNGMNVDENADAVKKDLGVVFQSSVLDKALTVRENLESRAALYGITGDAFLARLKELSELFDLEKLLRRPVGKLSGGQRRRVDIARALVHRPKLLILDEPTTGLDPQTRKNIWQVTETLRRDEGMTVFLTTHYMEEAADADYVVILSEGQIAAEGTPLDLKNKYTGDFITLYGVTPAQIEVLGVTAQKLNENAYRIAVPDTKHATRLITAHPDIFVDYEVAKGKMDDVFLAVTGTSLANP